MGARGILLFGLIGCGLLPQELELGTYDGYRNQQRIDRRDSLYVLHTVQEWAIQDWWTWALRPDMYKITPDQVSYFISGSFYSPDRTRALFWVGGKKPNAESVNIVGRRICPTAGDTIYHMSALIGIRDHVDQPWWLYPYTQQQVACSPDVETMLYIMGQFYFEEMKTKEMYRIAQSGERKGHKVLTAYGYNLQDEGFWEKCWLFERDTVGSYGLYPFQIKGYDYHGDPCTKNSAEPFELPVINYPQEIRDLYPAWK